MKKNKKEFSKVLLIQESCLIWIITICYTLLAFYCVWKGTVNSLPWVSSTIVAAWGAYGVSQGFYYNKSKAENTINGIKYETVIADIEKEKIMDSYYSGNIEDPESYQI